MPEIEADPLLPRSLCCFLDPRFRNINSLVLIPLCPMRARSTPAQTALPTIAPPRCTTVLDQIGSGLLVGGLPALGPAGLDVERYREFAMRRAGPFHDQPDHFGGVFDLGFRRFEQKLVMDLQ
jgi:hypothetical protein